jgi:hypothetical protein
MFAITKSVEEKISALECAYLQDSDLFSLDQYVSGFADRLKTYELLRDNAEKIANGALELLARDYPALMNKRGDRCKYDISEVLRYMATSILRNDEQYFRDQMVDWLNTILASYQVTTECASAYSHLYEVISQVLPAKCAAMAKPYTDMLVLTLRGAY